MITVIRFASSIATATVASRTNHGRRFLPVQGTAANIRHYFGLIADFADSVGVATPLLDSVAPLYGRFTQMGLDDKNVAAMINVIGALPRAGHRK
jgi:3-hydroxyisobutyrate dehydrogenase-like beta-hydroxyacid dehydrogenase